MGGAKRLLEGATLIVVYRTAATGGNVYIYDAFNNSMFASTADFYLYHGVESGSARFTMTGADGQRSSPNETSFFNGTQIAGPGGALSASDWDGSAGWPTTQLWDVQTHSVGVSGGTSHVQYNAGSDCLVPAAMVLDMW
jgi:hypothetical protein